MRRLSRIFALLLWLLTLSGIALTVSAQGSVTYVGTAHKFIFAPGTKESPTSLFENFKNVMPGDTLTEKIVIQNASDNKCKVRLYLRSKGAQEGTDEFLSQMRLTVQKNGKTDLYEAPADETAQLTDWVYLGTLYSGGKMTLDLTLEVPITMGDEFQYQVGYIDWEFKVEEIPVDPNDPSIPATGDSAEVFLYGAVMVVSLALLVLLIAGKRKKQEQE